MGDPWIYKGWDCDPPEGAEEPGCPSCGGGMSDFVFFRDGGAMCEDCYRQLVMEAIADMTTAELARRMGDHFVLKENWDGN